MVNGNLLFQDFEGQELALVDDQGAEFHGQVWDGSDVPKEFAIRGFYAVQLTVPTLEHIHFFLTKVLNWNTSHNVALNNEVHQSKTTYTIQEGGPGNIVYVIKDDQLEPAWQTTTGSVHHVAFRVKDLDQLHKWLAKLDQFGIPNSGIVDRYYFTSLYFRISRGILFELATDGPGFTADEDLDTLGQVLSLPPFLESQREHIEANLKPLR